MFKKFKPLMVIMTLFSLVFVLSGCSELVILDPKGPVAAIQRDLIMLSIYYMLFIIAVVYILFTWVVVKYRDRPGFKDKDYKPDMHGNTKLEIVWTVIPMIIVTALSIPTVQALYELEKPPKDTRDKEPIVIHATSVDWKWIFSYPEENIETVNYINIPEDRPILFKITSADSMSSLWIPQLGGQKYGMAGMENKLYLQADEPGEYDGRNSSFTGEGFGEQTFKVLAQKETDYKKWVQETQETAPKLTEKQYEKLMFPEPSDKMTFSSTHLSIVNHANNSEYALEVRQKYGVLQNPEMKLDKKDKEEDESESNSHHGSNSN